MKVTFGKAREVSYRDYEHPILIDGIEVAAFRASSYDPHYRSASAKSYAARFWLRREGSPIRCISASGPTLRAAKYNLLRKIGR
jgi:hypothetical protein